MEQREGGRRRIDRVSAADYLTDLSERPVAELRAMRDDCREEEARLSYERRLLQGKLDVATSELARRSSDDTDPDGLVAALPAILADDPSGEPREARTVGFYRPPEAEGGRRRDDLSLDEPTLATLPDLDDAALQVAVDQLRRQETEVSRARRTVLDHLDHLQSELVQRYRDGAEDLGEAVSSSLRPPAE